MDINAKIKWFPGMELTAETFNGWAQSVDARQNLMMRTLLGKRTGLLSGSEFSANGFFVKSSFEIDCLQCTGILRSGNLVSVDEPVKVNIPLMANGLSYLCVGTGAGVVEYERNEALFTHPEYTYSILKFEDVEKNDVLPLLRFRIEEGTWSIDEDFIPPYVFIADCPRLDEFRREFASIVNEICSHDHIPAGECRNLLLGYALRLSGNGQGASLASFIGLTHELAAVVESYIMRPYDENDTFSLLPACSVLDAQNWLSALHEWLVKALNVLNEVPVVDNSIDIEALKTQIRKELYGQMMSELSDSLFERLSETLGKRLDERIAQTLEDYTNGTFRNKLFDDLYKALEGSMKSALYDSLYAALYDALYKNAPVEEDTFSPLI
ncbi:MAG: hypothetical protein MJY76_01415 [Bacteroidales bacterium]|nr:hypothetical protein [Bacteroidales bacterium]